MPNQNQNQPIVFFFSPNTVNVIFFYFSLLVDILYYTLLCICLRVKVNVIVHLSNVKWRPGMQHPVSSVEWQGNLSGAAGSPGICHRDNSLITRQPAALLYNKWSHNAFEHSCYIHYKMLHNMQCITVLNSLFPLTFLYFKNKIDHGQLSCKEIWMLIKLITSASLIISDETFTLLITVITSLLRVFL